jgi:AcrR family transcriptional regulator
MKRKYDSSRRVASAAHTRQVIVETAVKLHGQGITSFSALAAEAGVSLPTVNKHFPTRESLFGACTRHLAESLDYPSPETLAAIEEPVERLRKVVWHIFSLHEATLGQMWLGYKLENESPTIAAALAEYKQLINSLADVLVRDQDTFVGVVRVMLSLLAYRALRVNEGLDFETAVDQTTRALAKILDVSVPAFAHQ